MTSRTIILLFASLAAAFYCGTAFSPQPQERPAMPGPSASHRKPSPTRATVVDRYENRPALEADVCIRNLDTWSHRSDAVSAQNELYDAVARLALDGFPEVDDYLRRIRGDLVYEARHVLYLRWANLDPFSLFTHFLESDQKLGYLLPISFGSLAARMVEADASATLNLVYQASQLNKVDKRMIKAVYMALASADSAGVANDESEAKFAYLAAISRSETVNTTEHTTAPSADPVSQFLAAIESGALENDMGLFAERLRDLKTSDPETAYRLLQELPDSREMRSFRLDTLATLAERDPLLAFAEFEQLYASSSYLSRNYGYASRLYKTLLENVPHAIAQWHDSHPDAFEANRILSDMLRHSNTGSPEMLNLALKLPDSNQRNAIVSSSVARFAATHWQEALDWTNANLSGRERQSALSALAMNGSIDQIDKRIQILDQIEQPEIRANAASRLAANWSSADFSSALAWAQSLADSQSREAALKALAHNWSYLDPQSARDFATALPDSTLKDHYERTLLQNTAAYESIDSLPDSITLIDDPNALQTYLAVAVDEQIVSNPSQALATLSSLDSQYDNVVQNVSRNLANRWSQVEPHRAAQEIWSAGGAVARSSLSQVINNLAAVDPEALLTYLPLLKDPDLRLSAVELMAHNPTLAQGHADLIEKSLQLLPNP